MGTPETVLNHKTHECTKERFKHITQKFECLCERKGRCACLKWSPITRHTSTQEERKLNGEEREGVAIVGYGGEDEDKDKDKGKGRSSCKRSSDVEQTQHSSCRRSSVHIKKNILRAIDD